MPDLFHYVDADPVWRMRAIEYDLDFIINVRCEGSKALESLLSGVPQFLQRYTWNMFQSQYFGVWYRSGSLIKGEAFKVGNMQLCAKSHRRLLNSALAPRET